MATERYEGFLGKFTYDNKDFMVLYGDSRLSRETMLIEATDEWNHAGVEEEYDYLRKLNSGYYEEYPEEREEDEKGSDWSPQESVDYEIEQYEKNGKVAIRYIGSETDGSKIKIPDGIVICDKMFAGCQSLKTPPKIPKGVESCNGMFIGCKSLRTPPVIPDGVKDCESMFKSCGSLITAPSVPESVVNTHDMFTGCVKSVQEEGSYNMEHRRKPSVNIYDEYFDTYDEYFKAKKVELTSYQSDPVCMAVMYHNNNEEEPDYLMPTVNLGSEIGNGTIMPKYCAFLDTNNYPGIDAYLVKNNLAEPYKRFGSVVTAQSGFCEYPLYKFNEEALKKVVPQKDIEKYEASYDEGFKNVQRQMNIDMFGFDPFAEGDESEDDYDDV